MISYSGRSPLLLHAQRQALGRTDFDLVAEQGSPGPTAAAAQLPADAGQRQQGEEGGSAAAARLRAQVGCLIGEVARIEEERDDWAARARALEADQSYQGAVKRALQERVASLAAALVHAEGRADALSQRADALSQRAQEQGRRAERLEGQLRGALAREEAASWGAKRAEHDKSLAAPGCKQGSPSRQSAGEAGAADGARSSRRSSVDLPRTPARGSEGSMRQRPEVAALPFEGSPEVLKQIWKADKARGEAACVLADSTQAAQPKRRSVRQESTRQRSPTVRECVLPCCSSWHPAWVGA
jgi:hypothetical protein